MKMKYLLFLFAFAGCTLDNHPHSYSTENYGPYAAYTDSIRMADSADNSLWGEWDQFKNDRQRDFVENIYYADSYEVYFGLLNEYLPIALPEDPTEYDKYLAALVQIDSLLDFPGYDGGTDVIYLYRTYEDQFDRWTVSKLTDLAKTTNIYSVFVDSAWSRYYNAMCVVVDTVVLGRPQLLGTISHLEAYSFYANHYRAQKKYPTGRTF